jgi:hypothetical protein
VYITVGGAVRESSIDNVYSTNPAYLSLVYSFKPCFVDNFAITLNCSLVREPNKNAYSKPGNNIARRA